MEANRGRVALARGPLVYCLEAVDNGGRVRSLSLPPGADLSAEHRSDLLGGVTVIRGNALASFRGDWPDALYSPPAKAAAPAGVDFLAVPYYANSNREPGDMTVWIPEMPGLAEPAPRPTIASEAMASASHCWKNDTVDALNDQAEPSRSDDGSIPRMTFWDHKGTTEWVQYDFAAPRKVSAVEVYWWDERRIGAHCRVPKSWRLLHRSGESWIPVSGAGPFAKQMDRFNRLAFEPVETTGLRIEVELEAEWSGGILEWRVE